MEDYKVIGKKRKSCLIVSLLIFSTILLSGCNSKYNKLVDEYEKLYDLSISEIDDKRVYESITENKIQTRLEDMDKVIEQIDADVPNPDSDKYVSIKKRHETLKGIIEKALNWDQLDDWGKFNIESDILTLKMVQSQPKK